MKKRIILILLVFGFLLSCAALIIYYRVLPKSAHQYYSENDQLVGQTLWTMAAFRGLYLSHHTSADGSYYIKMAYRDRKSKLKIVDLQVGGSNKFGEWAPLVIGSGNVISPDGGEIYDEYLKPGTWFTVTYLASVTNTYTPPIVQNRAQSSRISPLDFYNSGSCKTVVRLCEVAKYVEKNESDFWNFYNTGFFSGIEFPVISIELK